MRTNQQPLVQQSPGILDASVGARFDRLRAQTQRVLMALHVARPTRLALNDHTATVLAPNQRLYLGAARLTFGSSTSGAPHAERCRAGRPLLVVHRGESSIGPRDDPRTVLRKNAENTAAYGAGGWRGEGARALRLLSGAWPPREWNQQVDAKLSTSTLTVPSGAMVM